MESAHLEPPVKEKAYEKKLEDSPNIMPVGEKAQVLDQLEMMKTELPLQSAAPA